MWKEKHHYIWFSLQVTFVLLLNYFYINNGFDINNIDVRYFLNQFSCNNEGELTWKENITLECTEEVEKLKNIRIDNLFYFTSHFM